MSSSSPPPFRPPRWGLVTTWTLGITAVLGTLHARLGPGRSPGSDGSEARGTVVLGSPDRVVPVDRHRASRIDTFPGILGVGHAVELNGVWLLLDPGARRLHVIPDDPTRERRSFGREGAGPGELRFPSTFAVSGARVGVLEARGDRLVRYELDGSVVGPVSLTDGRCGFGPARAVIGGPDGGFRVLRTCTAMDGRMRALLLDVDREGRVRILEDRPLQALRTGSVDPYLTPVLAELGGAAYLGVLSDGCLHRIGRDPGGARGHGAATPEILCASTGSGVPLPDSVRTRFEALEHRMAAFGGDVVIPDRLPPFTGVRVGGPGLILEVPISEGRAALDLVDANGGRTRFTTEAPARTFIGHRHVLLVRDLMAGTELAWVPADG